MLLFLLPLLGLFAVVHSSGCYNAEKRSLNGRWCYEFYEGQRTFSEATGYCTHGTLASVHNIYDNEIIRGIADGLYWIGANHEDTLHRWQWSDGSVFNFTNWIAGGPGKPNVNDCVAVDSVTGLWKPVDCDQKLNFACENDPNPQITTTSPDCPQDVTCYNDFGYISPDAQVFSWQDGEKYCADKYPGGHLASLHDDKEEQLVGVMFRYTAFTNIGFIGGIVKNGNITWSDGTPFDYTHYYPGMGGDSALRDGQCLQMYSADVGQGPEEGWMLSDCSICGLGGCGNMDIAVICKFPLH